MASTFSDRSASVLTAQESRAADTGRYMSRAAAYGTLIVSSLLVLGPFLWMLLQSLMTEREVMYRALLPSSLHFDNYAYAWSRGNFNLYFWNSLTIAVITIIGVVFFSVLAAFAFARMEFPGKKILFFIFLASIMIPESVLLIPNFMVVKWLHDHSPIAWLNSWPALTIPFWSSPLAVFLLRQFFLQIPDDLWDSARMDGASPVVYLFKVVLPLSSAPILTVILFTFLTSWNSLAWPLLVTNTPDWRPISVGLYEFVGSAGPRQNLLMAGALITMAPVIFLYFRAQKHFTESIARMGVTG